MRGFEAVHAQRVGELTAMVEVMLDHVPDDPPAGEGVRLAKMIRLDVLL